MSDVDPNVPETGEEAEEKRPIPQPMQNPDDGVDPNSGGGGGD